MEERYYFSALNVLVKTNHDDASNAVHYASHRSLSPHERRLTEQFVLQKIDQFTDFYHRSPALLIYTGVEESLEKELHLYHLQGTIKTVIDRKEEIHLAVQNLIHNSLADYYFERVGEELLNLRHHINESANQFELDQIIENIQVLLNAYNENSGQNLSIKQILPTVLYNKAIRL